MLEADSPLLPVDMPEYIIDAIQRIACKSSMGAALTFNSHSGKQADPLAVAAEVYSMIEGIVRHGNYSFLPSSFNEQDSLAVVSRGAITVGTHFPQQMGLMVAHIGFSMAADYWGAHSIKYVGELSIVASTAAAASLYLQLAGIGEQEMGQASKFVCRHVSSAFREPNPSNYLCQLVDDINAGHFELINFPNIGEHPRAAVFVGGIIMALTSAQTTIEELGLPYPPKKLCREPLSPRRHPNLHAQYG